MQASAYRLAGQEPYAYTFSRTAMAAELHEQHSDLPDGEVNVVA